MYKAVTLFLYYILQCVWEGGGEKLVSKCPVFLVLNFHLPYVPSFSNWAVVLIRNIYQELNSGHNIALQTSKRDTCLILEQVRLDRLTVLPNIGHSGGNKHKTILIIKCLVTSFGRTSHKAGKPQDLGQHSLQMKVKGFKPTSKWEERTNTSKNTYFEGWAIQLHLRVGQWWLFS